MEQNFPYLPSHWVRVPVSCVSQINRYRRENDSPENKLWRGEGRGSWQTISVHEAWLQTSHKGGLVAGQQRGTWGCHSPCTRNHLIPEDVRPCA